MFPMLTATAAALMLGAVQTPARPADTAARGADPVVLTGCIASATEGKVTRFMLINASAAPAGADAATSRLPETGSTGVGTTGTGTSGMGSAPSPTTPQDTAQLTVLLTSDRSLPLRRHVNRRVEVQGRRIDSTEASKPAAGTADTSGPPQQLHVTKVRRVAGTCSVRK